MWKQFTVQGDTQYLDILPKILEEYSNTKHLSFKMTPTEASDKKYEGIVYFKLYGGTEQILSKPKFKVGDKVGISKIKEKRSIKDIHQIGLKKYSQLIRFNIRIQSLVF